MTKTTVKFTRKMVLTNPLILCAVGFGSGLLPVAPGTWGTVAGVFIYIGLSQLPLYVYITCLLFTFLFGIWCCSVASHKIGVHDHPSIVWDEFVGYWLTMLYAPHQWWWIVIGFGLFRIFDIYKPYPIGLCDRHCQGGLGVMLDDMLAGVYAWGVLQVLAWLVNTI